MVTIREVIHQLEQIAADYGDDLRTAAAPGVIVDLPARASVKPGYVARAGGGWQTLAGKPAADGEALVHLPAEKVLTFDEC